MRLVLVPILGHTSKVFQVKWHPVIYGVMCSGSDDFTVRVWRDCLSGKPVCVAVLEGHVGPVRGIVWAPALPHIIISGSWDAHIRVWDVTKAKTIKQITDHGADVYGRSWNNGGYF